MGIWIGVGLLAVGVLWLVATYNGLVALRNEIANAWRQIDVQLKRRHDLIPNLIETVRGVMRFEQDTLARVITARNTAMQAQGPADRARAEGELTRTLGQLFALAESYPDLKSNQNALQLQEELTSTENKLAFARQLYNDLVMRFNMRQQTFPASLVAGPFGFTLAEYFEVAPAEREAPKVDLSLR